MQFSKFCNIASHYHFPYRPALLGLGLIGLLGQIAWAPSPNSAPVYPSLSPPGSPREAPLASPKPDLPPSPAPVARSIFKIPITVTGYSSTVDQTDDSPYTTAMNTPVRPGIIALSRDLLRQFTPGAPFRFGDVVELEGVGVYTVEDTMNPRYAKRADIWFGSREAAQRWGRRTIHLARLTPRAQAAAYLVQSDGSAFEPALTD
jgi:3D (Asp-Asp-Asp) domain-containing protein